MGHPRIRDDVSGTGGYLCINCKDHLTEVRDSRRRESGGVRRRRYCEGCSFSFTTYEVPANDFAALPDRDRRAAKAASLAEEVIRLLRLKI